MPPPPMHHPPPPQQQHRILEDSSPHLTPEQHGLLSFAELSAMWYFGLAVWYGTMLTKHRRRRRQLQQPTMHDSSNSNISASSIHWFIFSISIMGLANFLFSFSLLEALDHRSANFASTVIKFSYVSK
jgi:hypothetical protein